MTPVRAGVALLVLGLAPGCRLAVGPRSGLRVSVPLEAGERQPRRRTWHRHLLANLYWQLGDRAAALPLYLDLLRRQDAARYRVEQYARAAQAAYILRDDALAVALEPAFLRDALHEAHAGHHVTMLYYAALSEARQSGHIEPIVRRLETLTRLAADSILTRVLQGIVAAEEQREGR